MTYSNRFEPLERRALLAAGQLDPSFGGGTGIVTTNLDEQVVDFENPVAVLPQTNGKVILVADAIDMPLSNEQPHRIVLLRYNVDGSLDSSFDGDGIVIDDVAGWESAWPQDAVRLGDESMLVYARLNRQFDPDDPDAQTQTFATLRYSASGVAIGSPTIIPTAERRQYLELGDGRVIVVGNDTNGTEVEHSDDVAFVSRMDANGNIDNTFGTNGRFILPSGFEDEFFLSLLDVRGDGRIVLAVRNHFVQLTPDGAIDTTFGGGDGIMELPASEWTYANFAAAPGGGFFATAWKAGNKLQPSVVVKLMADGNIDPDFSIGAFVGNAVGAEITLQPDGKILVHSGDSITRLNANGTRDGTFGSGGVFNASSTGGTNDIAMSITPAGIYGAGTWAGALRVYRLENNPTAGGGESSVFVQNDIRGLVIMGTLEDDVITIDKEGDSFIVTANGVTHTFSHLPGPVLISGGSGNDYIDLRDLPAIVRQDVAQPVTIEGGDGNDVLVGHGGADRILGGSGDDRINGWSGDDVISGNAQADRIDGGEGNDHVLGNGGRDRLGGNVGDDSIQGGDQPDRLFGHVGNDTLMGEGSHDRLDGGAGRDQLSGAGGNDTFFARDGEIDTVIGGLLGDDRALVDENDSAVGIEELLA